MWKIGKYTKNLKIYITPITGKYTKNLKIYITPITPFIRM